MIIEEETYLDHIGTKRHSGRYEWGSGGNESGSPRSMTFLDTVANLKRQGLSEGQIAQGMNISIVQLRAKKTIENSKLKTEQIQMAERLKAKAMSNGAIAERMGLQGESSVRALLAPGALEKAQALTKTADILKAEVDAKKYLDVGTGVESRLNISKERLGAAVAILQEYGYKLHEVSIRQLGTGHDTRHKVLTPPGTEQKEVFLNRFAIKQFGVFTEDSGHRWGRLDHAPVSINPNRVAIKYQEDGGDKADGIIYVRPGKEDISLGKARYSQVRILVGEDHYLKGMAMYKDDLPEGTDLLFHTSKSKKDLGSNKRDAMKKIEDDKDYPFGSVVRQLVVDPGGPNEHVKSAMNLVNEEGDWAKWSENISSQVLSKQSPVLAKAQLNMTYERRKKEFDEIMTLTNPTVKKKLLQTFADSSDAASVHLKAAALPRSNWHAILPISSLPPTQIYAPGYQHGERVALIRYPHGGRFEIPELTVNNKHPESKRLLGSARDAVGIHHSVAEHLSGADFDGDTVLVIPNASGKIKSSPPLEGLKNFNPRTAYPAHEGMVRISSARKQAEMGNISNLITDMTLKAAPPSEIAAAVRHSMVVIDSEKHNLDYKASAVANGIPALKRHYQGGPRAGASTLISRKKTEDYIPDRKARPQAQGGPINPVTGRKEYVPTNRMRTLKDGTTVPKKIKVKKLAEADDAHSLLTTTATPMEKQYADHSNRLKALANQARLESLKTPLLKYEPSANKVYAKEVASLNSKLALVIANRPLERQAQIIANAAVKAKRDANPNLEKDSIRKIEFQEQAIARQRTGAKGRDVKITADEWNAIQAGAITDNKLTQILAKADLEEVRKLATPHKVLLMTSSKIDRAKQMLASGYNRADVAAALGVSLTTLDASTVVAE